MGNGHALGGAGESGDSGLLSKDPHTHALGCQGAGRCLPGLLQLLGAAVLLGVPLLVGAFLLSLLPSSPDLLPVCVFP